MKKLFLFSTKLYYFWTVLPLALLLFISIYFNGSAEGVFKLYPLIVLSSAGIIFILVYFFRGIIFSYDDARCVGLFSKKEHARYEKDYTLQITPLKKGRLLIEVFGFPKDGYIGYDWYSSDDVAEINLLRARTNGTQRTVRRILAYYGIEESDINSAVKEDGFKTETKDVILITTKNNETELRTISLVFKELERNSENEDAVPAE